MARTEIHPISTTLNIAIDYIIDPEKTDDQMLCSSYECTLQCATMDFEDIRRQGTGRTTVLAEHISSLSNPAKLLRKKLIKLAENYATNILKDSINML